jgi:hypothetical protein
MDEHDPAYDFGHHLICSELITRGPCREEPELNADGDRGLEDTTIATTRRE